MSNVWYGVGERERERESYICYSTKNAIIHMNIVQFKKKKKKSKESLVKFYI